jgi:hypothetical protein
MPLQNRVDAYGQLHAVAARGAWMGNRGILHDDARQIVAPWRLQRWITCVLSFKGRRRKVFAPHRYSELFFLDEATSFAAGHRPCAECRRERYNEFRLAWIDVGANRSMNRLVRAEEIDCILHSERAIRGGGKRTYVAKLESLPSGTFVEHETRAHLIRNGKLWPWSFIGYDGSIAVSSAPEEVVVLTPQSIVRIFAAGFQPQVHESAGT